MTDPRIHDSHIGALTPDEDNARRHNPRNIGMIGNALQEVGAARSIVIDEYNVVLAGNGTLEAAGQVGIENLLIVDAPGDTLVAVRRTGLTDAQKRKLALYDNRTGELAEWDANVLLAQASLVDLSDLFYDSEMTALMGLAEEDRKTGFAVMDAVAEDDEPVQAQTRQAQKTFPLAIIIDRATYAEWEAFKAGERLRDDSTAFLRLFRARSQGE
jgi:hypothetical protein